MNRETPTGIFIIGLRCWRVTGQGSLAVLAHAPSESRTCGTTLSRLSPKRGSTLREIECPDRSLSVRWAIIAHGKNPSLLKIAWVQAGPYGSFRAASTASSGCASNPKGQFVRLAYYFGDVSNGLSAHLALVLRHSDYDSFAESF